MQRASDVDLFLLRGVSYGFTILLLRIIIVRWLARQARAV